MMLRFQRSGLDEQYRWLSVCQEDYSCSSETAQNIPSKKGFVNQQTVDILVRCVLPNREEPLEVIYIPDTS